MLSRWCLHVFDVDETLWSIAVPCRHFVEFIISKCKFSTKCKDVCDIVASIPSISSPVSLAFEELGTSPGGPVWSFCLPGAFRAIF